MQRGLDLSTMDKLPSHARYSDGPFIEKMSITMIVPGTSVIEAR